MLSRFRQYVFLKLIEVFGSQYCPAFHCRGRTEDLIQEKVEKEMKIKLIILILVNHGHQVAQRLLQEQDNKDLLIILGDIPVLKVSFQFIVFSMTKSNTL